MQLNVTLSRQLYHNCLKLSMHRYLDWAVIYQCTIFKIGHLQYQYWLLEIARRQFHGLQRDLLIGERNEKAANQVEEPGAMVMTKLAGKNEDSLDLMSEGRCRTKTQHKDAAERCLRKMHVLRLSQVPHQTPKDMPDGQGDSWPRLPIHIKVSFFVLPFLSSLHNPRDVSCETGIGSTTKPCTPRLNNKESNDRVLWL